MVNLLWSLLFRPDKTLQPSGLTRENVTIVIALALFLVTFAALAILENLGLFQMPQFLILNR